ncbi:MAG: ParB/Srx family N-terminal domain-containing protein [Undibacterium sp.]
MSKSDHTIEIWELDKIKPYERNAKKHPKEQVEKLAASIREFGYNQPIVVDADGIIIAGHGRRLAAIVLGRKVVPVICRRDLTKNQADALRLSDNRVASTEYDMSEIEAELRRLNDSEFDISSIGFDENEINFSLADLGAMDDEVFVGDIGAAVTTQQEENARASEVTDDIAAPVSDAFGFKRVTIAQSRMIRELMSKIEKQTGKTGVEALIEILSANIT